MSNKTIKEKQPEQKRSNALPLLIGVGIVAILAILLFAVLRQRDRSNDEHAPETASGPVATISIKDYGDIVVQLDEEAAPLSVENFVKLARDGFYDGLTFHRIIDGFMMQGGAGEGAETIKGEFAENGVDNPISHVRGVISMARASDMDSASSQFFIVQSDSTYLDGSYAGFGYVTSGMEIVDEICKNTPVQDNNGTVNEEDQPVIESITIAE